MSIGIILIYKNIFMALCIVPKRVPFRERWHGASHDREGIPSPLSVRTGHLSLWERHGNPLLQSAARFIEPL